MTEENTPAAADYTTEEGREKLLAEIEKTRVETAKLANEDLRAQIEDARKAEKHKIELQGLRATVKREEDQAVLTGILRDQNVRQERSCLSDNRYHYTYNFGQEVSRRTVTDCIEQITEWTRDGSKHEITIVFNSPGGSAIDGMHLWDFLQYVKTEGHTVVTKAFGMAASMAGILLQAGDTRILGRESYLLIHEISFGAGGKIGEIEDTVAFVKMMQNRVLDLFADRSSKTLMARGETGNKLPKTVFAEHRRLFAKNWARKDWWIDSEEAYRLGLVDEIR